MVDLNFIESYIGVQYSKYIKYIIKRFHAKIDLHSSSCCCPSLLLLIPHLGRPSKMLDMEIDQVLGRLLMLERRWNASVVGDLPRLFLPSSLLNEPFHISTVFHYLKEQENGMSVSSSICSEWLYAYDNTLTRLYSCNQSLWPSDITSRSRQKILFRHLAIRPECLLAEGL